ncbi:MAG: PAN domain-containing protein [Erythrobacter sp.]
MFRKFALTLAAGALATSPFLASTITAQGNPARSLTLYNEEDLGGAGVTVSQDVANLQSVRAAAGFDGTANDYAFSLRAEGRWQVCMDAGYKTDCMIVDGEVASLGDKGGSISSVRYLGPSAHTAAAPQSRAPVTGETVAAPQPADDWQPMYNVDLFGNDYREIIYTSAGNDWRTCKAACDGDRQCQAWTYVGPGRSEYGECYLKAPVPEPAQSSCCISGIKGAASAEGAVGDDAIARGVRRLGETATSAAEDELNRAVDRKVRGLLGRIID